MRSRRTASVNERTACENNPPGGRPVLDRINEIGPKQVHTGVDADADRYTVEATAPPPALRAPCN